MTTPLILECGDLRCEIAPALGAAVAGFWAAGLPVLRSTPAAALVSARDAGSYPLVPFSNRIGQATLLWNGTSHPLVRNFPPEPHSIHGVGWQRPWQVLEADTCFALLSLEHQPDAAWPFAFDCSQAFRLDAGGLAMSLSVTNQGGEPAPFGLGWHPYFVKRADCRIRFAATGRWEMGEDHLPTHRSASAGLDTACAGLEVDHCFDGWQGAVQLHDALLHTEVRSSLDRLVVYTQPQRDFIAIEPVSHVNNALHRAAHAGASPGLLQALGVQVLQPGASMSAEMRISVRSASAHSTAPKAGS